jgi:hypothetical protein
LLAPPAPLLGDAGVHVAQGVDELNVESGLSPSHSFAGQGQVPENLFYFIFLLIYFLKVGNDPLGGRRRLDHAARAVPDNFFFPQGSWHVPLTFFSLSY